MSKIYKGFSPIKAARTCLQKMNEGGFDFVYFTNDFTNKSYVMKKRAVELKAQGKDSDPADVVEINMLSDEYLYEMDANGVDEIAIKEGSIRGEGSVNAISRSECEAAKAIKKGIDFDFSSLFEQELSELTVDDIQAGLQKGVYVSTAEELIENRKDLDDSDLSWSVDFSRYKYWITTDDGADPIGCDTLEEIKYQHYYRGE
jgi:ribonucleotide monophosphatase NagD (HAD superfamily)